MNWIVIIGAIVGGLIIGYTIADTLYGNPRNVARLALKYKIISKTAFDDYILKYEAEHPIKKG